MTTPEVLSALAQALERDPKNGPLWLHYADLLATAGKRPEALKALRMASEIPPVRAEALMKLVRALLDAGELSEAMIRAEGELEHREDPELRSLLEKIHQQRGSQPMPPEPDASVPAAAPPRDTGERREALAEVDEETDSVDWAAQFDWGDLRVTFADVAGLEDVKRQIRLRIIAPFKNPAIFEAFARTGGGGLLLYGPPGCGKTFVARATAGELGARFMSVSIHSVLDKYWGESEKLVHGLFEHARRNAPIVLFFDEFDALGSGRGRSDSQFWKTIVDQLLQEMDGVASRNRDILLLAATNVPWNVDAAFRRPGRFDRVLFVTPPDEPARHAILERHARALPGGDALDLDKLARKTDLFSGADLRALCERGAEAALERSLESGKVHTVSQKDLDAACAASRSTVLEWLATARNHARYSNEGGQYDELVEYLKRVRKW